MSEPLTAEEALDILNDIETALIEEGMELRAAEMHDAIATLDAARKGLDEAAILAILDDAEERDEDTIITARRVAALEGQGLLATNLGDIGSGLVVAAREGQGDGGRPPLPREVVESDATYMAGLIRGRELEREAREGTMSEPLSRRQNPRVILGLDKEEAEHLAAIAVDPAYIALLRENEELREAVAREGQGLDMLGTDYTPLRMAAEAEVNAGRSVGKYHHAVIIGLLDELERLAALAQQTGKAQQREGAGEDG